MAETFVAIRGYKDYEISNMGRIRSTKSGTARILKNRVKDNDYLYVTLCNEKGQYNFYVHRLVAMHHLPTPSEGKIVVDHKSRTKTDNRACNLRWATQSENCFNRDVYGFISENKAQNRIVATNIMQNGKTKSKSISMNDPNARYLAEQNLGWFHTMYNRGV